MLINELGRIYPPRNQALSMPRDCPLLAQPRPLTSVQQVTPPSRAPQGWVGEPPPWAGLPLEAACPPAGKRQDAGAGLCVQGTGQRSLTQAEAGLLPFKVGQGCCQLGFSWGVCLVAGPTGSCNRYFQRAT